MTLHLYKQRSLDVARCIIQSHGRACDRHYLASFLLELGSTTSTAPIVLCGALSAIKSMTDSVCQTVRRQSYIGDPTAIRPSFLSAALHDALIQHAIIQQTDVAYYLLNMIESLLLRNQQQQDNTHSAYANCSAANFAALWRAFVTECETSALILQHLSIVTAYVWRIETLIHCRDGDATINAIARRIQAEFSKTTM